MKYLLIIKFKPRGYKQTVLKIFKIVRGYTADDAQKIWERGLVAFGFVQRDVTGSRREFCRDGETYWCDEIIILYESEYLTLKRIGVECVNCGVK